MENEVKGTFLGQLGKDSFFEAVLTFNVFGFSKVISLIRRVRQLMCVCKGFVTSRLFGT